MTKKPRNIARKCVLCSGPLILLSQAASGANVGYFDFNSGGIGGAAYSSGSAAATMYNSLQGSATNTLSLTTSTGASLAPGTANAVYNNGTTVNAIAGDTAGSYLSILDGAASTGSTFTNDGTNLVFNLDLTNYTGLSLSYATIRTSTGFAQQTVKYSLDGGSTFTTVATFASPTALTTETVSAFAALDYAASAIIEITLSSNGATNASSAGNVKFDNVLFTATPEPTSAIFCVLGGTVLIGRRRKIYPS